MNGRTAKKLRRLARQLKLDPENKYAPVGQLVHLPERTYVDRASGEKRTLPGGVLRRPFALQVCERRAYHEAKAIYKGGVVEKEVAESLYTVQYSPSFKDQLIGSVKAQPEGPVE